MGPSLARLPRLLLVLVLGFAPYEAHPTLAAAELYRGMAIQLGYRWASGRVLAELSSRAVLLWTDCRALSLRRAGREALGIAVGVAIGIVLFVLSNAMLLGLVTLILKVLHASATVIMDVRLTIVVVRLAVTLVRAVAAYLHDRTRDRRLPATTGLRWRLDLLAAVPAGAGHGRRLLGEFLTHADRHDAEVALFCDYRNLQFYQHHGFAVLQDDDTSSQYAMIRPRASWRRDHARRVVRGSLQGHLRKARTSGS